MRSGNQKEFGAFTTGDSEVTEAREAFGSCFHKSLFSVFSSVFSVRSVVRLPRVFQAAQIFEHSSTEFGKQFLTIQIPSLRPPCLCGAFSLNLRVADDGQNVQHCLRPRPAFSSI